MQMQTATTSLLLYDWNFQIKNYSIRSALILLFDCTILLLKRMQMSFVLLTLFICLILFNDGPYTVIYSLYVNVYTRITKK